MPPARFLSTVLTVLALAAGFSACGSDEEEEVSAGSGGSAAATATATPAPDVDNTDVRKRPTIDKPTGEPPTELKTEDIVRGEGRRARSGDTLTMHYVGASWSTGEEFDASWDRGEPFRFELGAGRVIQGWDRGIEGMRVGGRRRLIIPPDMGYGPAGSPPAIAPNETLIFIVDLIGIE